MLKKPTFDKNTSQSQTWAPRALASSQQTVSNRSSESFNIITGDPNLHSPQIAKHDLLVKKHGRVNNITAIRDLQHGGNAVANEDYGQAMKCNPRVFSRKDGMFTHLYNSAHRFGEDKPFKA